MTYPIQSRAGGSQLSSSLRLGTGPYAGFLFATLLCSGVSAQEAQSTPDTQATEEISIVKQRQTQLNSEALSISDTPDAEPHVNGISGVAAAQAAQATALDNPLTAYTPKAGLSTAGVTAAGVYQVSRHWGLIGRLELQDLIGSQPKNSPLTQRAFQPAVAFGAAYQF